MLRYKIYVLFLTLTLLVGTSYIKIKATSIELPLLSKVIYLDAGHGGIDGGAEFKGIKEKDINLKIVKKLETKLLKLGAIVYLTRNGDYDLSVPNTINRKRSDLSRRGNIINKSMCDIFLSIHLNSEQSEVWNGPQVFYDDIEPKNKNIAELFQKELNKTLKGRREYKKVDDLYLQKRITRPGILIEVGFLSNANDRYLLKQDSYQDKVATLISNILIMYFKK